MKNNIFILICSLFFFIGNVNSQTADTVKVVFVSINGNYCQDTGYVVFKTDMHGTWADTAYVISRGQKKKIRIFYINYYKL